MQISVLYYSWCCQLSYSSHTCEVIKTPTHLADPAAKRCTSPPRHGWPHRKLQPHTHKSYRIYSGFSSSHHALGRWVGMELTWSCGLWFINYCSSNAVILLNPIWFPISAMSLFLSQWYLCLSAVHCSSAGGCKMSTVLLKHAENIKKERLFSCCAAFRRAQLVRGSFDWCESKTKCKDPTLEAFSLRSVGSRGRCHWRVVGVLHDMIITCQHH